MVYRSSAGGCPSCGTQLGKVESEGHLIGRCPDCGGAWIEAPTLVSVWGGAIVLGDGPVRPRTRACFFCGRDLEERSFAGVPVGSCPLHGLWFELDELIAGAAAAAEPMRGHLGRLALVLDAGGVVAYRKVGLCLSCGRRLTKLGGDRPFHRCPGCGGCFVHATTLRSMWSTMSPTAPLVIEPRKGDIRRPCVVCGRLMHPTALHRVPVDDCPLHGTWFDAEELATALAAAVLPEKEWLDMFADALRDMR
jgi:Zn-finger nucleic acid-binding protein